MDCLPPRLLMVTVKRGWETQKVCAEFFFLGSDQRDGVGDGATLA